LQNIRFRLGHRPRPRWGSLQRSAGYISGVLLLLKEEGVDGKKEMKGNSVEEGKAIIPALNFSHFESCFFLNF